MNLARVAEQFAAVFPAEQWEDYGKFAHRDAATAAAWSLEFNPRFHMDFAVRVVQRDGWFVLQRQERK